MIRSDQTTLKSHKLEGNAAQPSKPQSVFDFDLLEKVFADLPFFLSRGRWLMGQPRITSKGVAKLSCNGGNCKVLFNNL